MVVLSRFDAKNRQKTGKPNRDGPSRTRLAAGRQDKENVRRFDQSRLAKGTRTLPGKATFALSRFSLTLRRKARFAGRAVTSTNARRRARKTREATRVRQRLSTVEQRVSLARLIPRQAVARLAEGASKRGRGGSPKNARDTRRLGRVVLGRDRDAAGRVGSGAARHRVRGERTHSGVTGSQQHQPAARVEPARAPAFVTGGLEGRRWT